MSGRREKLTVNGQERTARKDVLDFDYSGSCTGVSICQVTNLYTENGELLVYGKL